MRVSRFVRTLPLWLTACVAVGCIKREAVDCSPGAMSGTATAGQGAAATGRGAPGTGISLLAGLETFQVNGEKEKVRVAPVSVQAAGFDRALRAEVRQASNSEWSVQVQAPIVAPVENGDILLATFHVRAVKPQESGRAETQFVFERAAAPYTKSVTHPVPVTPEWRKVQVRFTSAEAYKPGEAQVIFRLGYEPETIEIGGVTVENFGKNVVMWDLPSTETQDRALANEPIQEAPLAVVDGGELGFTVTPGKLLGAISPYVYGINSQPLARTRATVRRMGGNRQSAYNWELNASSAGNDYKHVNDDWPCTVLGYRNCGEPGGQFTSFVLDNRKQGVESLVTIPMLDYVSADKTGEVKESEKAPSARYVRSFPQKKGAYSLAPDQKDGAVYQDEFVHFLVQKLGRAAQGGTRFYSLDNEPALWSSTHPRVHPERPTYKEVVNRTETTALAITKLDPTATVLGGVLFGWSEFMSLSSAVDSKEHNAKYGTYVDYFLASMRALEDKHKRRLVHVFDVHWYPEMRGNRRITEDDVTQKTVDARLAAPRSFWDPTFKEKSWIGDSWGKPIRLIPWLRERIAERYPGTKLAMTEYNFGAGDHVSGGLAQADVLGIFGREGMYLANYWGNGPGNGELPKYIRSAYELYRNYDGKGGSFGDTAVAAVPADLAKASIYAATDAKQGTLTLVVINKDQRASYRGKIRLEGGKYTRAEAFAFDGSSPNVRPLGALTVQESQLAVNLPALSATLVVLR